MGIRLKRLWSWACWAYMLFVCSIPSQTDLEAQNLSSPKKNSKIPNRTVWAAASRGLWLEYETETQTYRGTCRTHFDDAVEQTFLSDNTVCLIVVKIQSAPRDVRVIPLVKGHRCKSRTSASFILLIICGRMVRHARLVILKYHTWGILWGLDCGNCCQITFVVSYPLHWPCCFSALEITSPYSKVKFI